MVGNSSDHLEGTRKDVRVILKWTLKKWVEYCRWLGVRRCMGFYELSDKPPVVAMIGNVLISLLLATWENPMTPLYFSVLHTNIFMLATGYHKLGCDECATVFMDYWWKVLCFLSEGLLKCKWQLCVLSQILWCSILFPFFQVHLFDVAGPTKISVEMSLNRWVLLMCQHRYEFLLSDLMQNKANYAFSVIW